MRTKKTRTTRPFLKTPRFTASYLPEPLLEFAGGRRHVDPKTGIIRFGPKSLSSQNRHPARIRTGFIGTAETIEKAGSWIEKTSNGVRGAPERLEFPGFRADRGFFAEVEQSPDWNAPIFGSDLSDIKSHRLRIGRFDAALSMLNKKLETLSRKDRPPEYVIVALPDDLLAECQTVQTRSAEHGVVIRNLRRALKAIAMRYRLPTQILLEKTTSNDEPDDYPSDIAWDFYTAMYFKAGGFPWGPVGLTPASCFLGVSFFRPFGTEDARVQSSLVQAFDEHGDGLVLRGQDFLWDAKREGSRAPHLSAEQATWIVNHTLDRYRDEMGQFPTRMVIHKSSRYWPAETEGFRVALDRRNIQYDLAALAPTDTVRLFPVNQYPPLRGTRFTLDDLDYIYTTGFQSDLQQFHANHVPSPLQLADHIGGDTSRGQLLTEILVLSKLNWNCSLMGGLMPITQTFARRVGDILREIPPGFSPLANFKYYM